MASRIPEIFASLKEHNLDGIIVSSPANIAYLTGYPGRDSYLLATRKKSIYFTDSRYSQEAKISLKGVAVEVREVKDSIFKLIALSCARLDLNRVGFEENRLSFGSYRRIKEDLGEEQELVPMSDIVEALRQIKTSDELKKIRKAVGITIQALNYIKGYIRPGKREIEVAAELERFIRYNGAGSSAFDIIVASGANSSFPHYMTSRKIIRDGEPVLIDVGVDYQGYKSDLTRVFFSGKINTLFIEVYNTVLTAQKKAIEAIRPAVDIKKIDAYGRDFIIGKGFGCFFGHALGHGIGLEVHESPGISAKESNKLKPGMVFTVEPGIYLPGKFGVRLEDMIVVTKKGYEVLSGSLDK